MNEAENVGEEIMQILEKNRDWRRQHRKEFLAEIAEDLWRTMPDDEALDDFRMRLDGVPWWASDVVQCLEWTLRERPPWAASTLAEASERGNWLGVSVDENPEKYLSWLADQAKEMRRALDDAR